MANGSFFRDFITVLRSRKSRINYERLEKLEVAADERCIQRIEEVFRHSTDCVLVGPRDSGKTVTASILGFRLCASQHWVAFYGDASDLTDFLLAVREIQAYENFDQPALFILENYHRNPSKVDMLLNGLPANRQNARLLLTTRHLGEEWSPLRALHEDRYSARTNPERLRAEIVRKHVETLKAKAEYRNASYLPKDQSELEKQCSLILPKLPQRNLRILDLFLQAWDPRNVPLDAVQEVSVLNVLLATADPRLDTLLAAKCLLPLYAVGQFEVRVHCGYLDVQGLAQLEDLGLVSYDRLSGMCRLRDPSEAPWYLGAAQHAKLLRIDGQVGLKEYVRHHVQAYGAIAPNPHELLRGVRESDPALARTMLGDAPFLSNVSGLVATGDFYRDFPLLLSEVRSLDEKDTWTALVARLDDKALKNIAESDLHTFESYLSAFAAGGKLGWELSRRLLSQEQAHPEKVGPRLRVALASDELSAGELAWLLYLLNSRRDYDMATLFKFLDLDYLRGQFPETRLTSYMALVRETKRGMVGLHPVRALMPDVGSLAPRLKGSTMRHLREVMDAQLMRDRKELWQQLGEEDLQKILSRSTLNQCHNLLEDALESANTESLEFGKHMAARLLGMNLGSLILKAGLKDVGMFVGAVIELDAQLAEPLLNQLVRVGLHKLIEAEKDKWPILGHLAHLLRHFNRVPQVAVQFLTGLIQLNLEAHVRASQPDGLRSFTYTALWVDEEKAREWCLSLPTKLWQAKITESSPEEAHYLLWNLYQTTETLACILAETPGLADKLETSAEGFGLLSLCGLSPTPSESVVHCAAAAVSGGADAQEPEYNPARFALILKALCHPSMREMAVSLRQRIDLAQMKQTFELANVPHRTKQLLLAILAEFAAASE